MEKNTLCVGIIGTFPPPYGGVSTHIKALKNFLDDKNMPVKIFNIGGCEESNRNIINIESSMNLFLELMKSKCDLFHAHGGTDLYKKILILNCIKVLKKKPFIMTIHSGGIVKDLQRKSSLIKYFIKVIFNHAVNIVCVSDKIKKSMQSIGISIDSCLVVPAFSINNEIDDQSISKEIKNFIFSHQPLLSCLGYSFEDHYGYSIAINALNILKNIYPNIGMIIMGGDLHGSDYRKFLSKVKPEELDHVMITGAVDQNNVFYVMKNSDLFLRPTFHDGDANSIREALAIGTKVIASNPVKRPLQVILFENKNHIDLAEKIQNEIESDDIRKISKNNFMIDTSNLAAVFKIYMQFKKES